MPLQNFLTRAILIDGNSSEPLNIVRGRIPDLETEQLVLVSLNRHDIEWHGTMYGDVKEFGPTGRLQSSSGVLGLLPLSKRVCAFPRCAWKRPFRKASSVLGRGPALPI